MAQTWLGPTRALGSALRLTLCSQPDGEQQLVQTWGMRGAYTHNWNPYWSTSLYGAFAAVHYNDEAKDLICGPGGVGGSFRRATGLIGTCNPTYNIAQLGFVTRWTPVKNLTFSAEVTYTHLDQKMAGTIVSSRAAIGKPAAVYEMRDQDTLLLQLRAQRNW